MKLIRLRRWISKTYSIVRSFTITPTITILFTRSIDSLHYRTACWIRYVNAYTSWTSRDEASQSYAQIRVKASFITDNVIISGRVWRLPSTTFIDKKRSLRFHYCHNVELYERLECAALRRIIQRFRMQIIKYYRITLQNLMRLSNFLSSILNIKYLLYL